MRKSIIGLLVLLCLAGCSQGLTQASQIEGTPVPLNIDCHTAYRSSVTVEIEREELISVSADSDQVTAFGDLEFHLQYTDGSEAWEGRTLRLAVSEAGADQELTAQLYQLSKRAIPYNQFEGGHGFTGLVYSYHPNSGAELQYWCVAR
jgi:hypothetical protein